MTQPAILALEDGSVFTGISVGAAGKVTGEIQLNTTMTGYQEALTNPNASQQLMAFTYPHIGNSGINEEDHLNLSLSQKITAQGVILRSLAPVASNFRSNLSLEDWLIQQGVPAIAEIDTRKLAKVLRLAGGKQQLLKACLIAGEEAAAEDAAEQAIALAKAAPSLAGQDLTQELGVKEITPWQEGNWRLGEGYSQLSTSADVTKKVVVYDLGVQANLLRQLTSLGCSVTLVPATTPLAEALALNPQGVVLSNGAGCPAAASQALALTKELLATDLPLLGFGLGSQLIGLSLGATHLQPAPATYGANHPVQNLASKQVSFSVQSQSFALSAENLPADIEATDVSLFNGSLQGFKLANKPVFGLQALAEAQTTSRQANSLLNQFVQALG